MKIQKEKKKYFNTKTYKILFIIKIIYENLERKKERNIMQRKKNHIKF